MLHKLFQSSDYQRISINYLSSCTGLNFTLEYVNFIKPYGQIIL